MMDDIHNMNDLTRLYQLYMMTDKILSTQLKSKSGINYELLKKFKNISIRINDINMSNATLKINNIGEESKDFYSEQDKLNTIVKTMEDAINARNMLISKYRNYSVLPLNLEDTINLDDFDYYRDKLDKINDYIQNDIRLTKLNQSLNSLGVELGNKTNAEEKILNLIPIFEKKLISSVLDNDKVKQELSKLEINIDTLSNDNQELKLKYKEISNIFDEISEKYEVMKLVKDDNYLDIVMNITNEYNTAKYNKNFLEILNQVLNKVNDYESFIEKRTSIKECLLNINKNIFGNYLDKLLSSQLDEFNKVETLRQEIENIKEQIHKNNALINRINRNQKELQKELTSKKENYKVKDNQIIKIADSYISYSKERVYNVLKFISNKIQNKNEKDQVFEEIKDSDNLFIDNSNPQENIESPLDFKTISEPNDIFVEKGSMQTENFNKDVGKIEPYDDILKDNSNNTFKPFDFKTDIISGNISPDIPNSKIQFLDSNNNFWPNIV